jgi:hypothetical protein
MFIEPSGPCKPPELPLGPKSVSNHLLRFRQIQSEMQSVLQQRPPPGYSPVDLVTWRSTMHQRIRAWFKGVPRAPSPSDYERKVIENFGLTYYRALLYLYEASAEHIDYADATSLVVADAVTQIIPLYRKFFHERRLTIYWQAIENLSAAGVALLRRYSRSTAVRNTITMADLQKHVQTCSSLLWAMVEHFPRFRDKRDSFDDISAQIMASITSEGDSRQSALESNKDVSIGDDIGITGASNRPPPGDFHALPQPEVDRDPELDQTMSPHPDHAAITEYVMPTYADFENAAFDWDAIAAVDEEAFASWV